MGRKNRIDPPTSADLALLADIARIAALGIPGRFNDTLERRRLKQRGLIESTGAATARGMAGRGARWRPTEDGYQLLREAAE